MTRLSPCKVNLILNILGKRADGFHELETVLQPVGLHDEIDVERAGSGVELTCDHPELPTDGRNLVTRAVSAFLGEVGCADGLRVHLRKRLPLAAGLGGGSANAACMLRALNDLFGGPLDGAALHRLAAGLGSDVPFFLQDGPALATGRGERIQPLESFDLFRGFRLVLVHPGFGISTAWAYGQLGQYPEALHGRVGRAAELVGWLRAGDLPSAGRAFYNSLEAPALVKYPILALYQEFFRDHGAVATLMSGSGSTTFAMVRSQAEGEGLLEGFRSRFGGECWTAIAGLG